MAHICFGNLTIICSDNGLSPGRRQVIIWTNAGILLIRTLGTNFNGILIKIHTFSFMKMHLKMSSAKWRQYCLGLNVLSPCNSFDYRVPVDFINCHSLRSTGLKWNITSSRPSGTWSKDKTPSNIQQMLIITKVVRYSMTDGACVPKRFPKKCTFGNHALVVCSVGTKQLTIENVVSWLRQIGNLNWCKNLMTVFKRDQIVSTLLVAL